MPSQNILIPNLGNAGGETRVGGGDESTRTHIRSWVNLTNNQEAPILGVDRSRQMVAAAMPNILNCTWLLENLYRFHKALLLATLKYSERDRRFPLQMVFSLTGYEAFSWVLKEPHFKGF